MCRTRITALLLLISGVFWPTFFTAAEPKGAPAELTFVVAPDGNDQGPGTKEQPFATLERARAAIRTARQQPGKARPISVLIRGGTYSLTSPLVLGPEDSGTAEAPVTFAAYEGEKPVLSGGRRLTGWKSAAVAGKPLWAVELPEVRTGEWDFHQLWVNGQRRPRARHPNEGFLRVAGLPDAKPDTPRNEGQQRFQFAAGDVKAWENLQDVDIVALHLWVSVRLAVTAVDEEQRLVTFAHKSRRRLTDGAQPARYYVENAFELLDAPGEWYLDRKTGVLHYWPLPGEDLARAEVVAPVLPHLLRFDGRPEAGRTVDHVTVRGLMFAHADWWPARTDPLDIQAAAPVPGAVQGEGMRHCTLERCTVAHVSGYAVHLGRGCQHNRVQGCDLFDLGAGGVKVGEMMVRDAPAHQTHDNAVNDNHIHDGGLTFHQAVGVWVGQSFGNRVAHNHIHDLYYSGISCGWTWGYGKSLARDNVIEFNHVHDLGKAWLSDMGGIYTLGARSGTVIRGNVFHDIAGHNYGGWGIYFDEGSSQVVAEDNLVYRTTHGGFHQHFGKDNVVRNNVFALGRDAQVRRSKLEPHRSFTFERNLVYWKQGKLLDGKWDQRNADFDHNLYWPVGGGDIRFDKLTWEQWRAQGADKDSLLADPLFVNPEKNDFHLQPTSPARQVGFVAPDWSRVGPRPEFHSAPQR